MAKETKTKILQAAKKLFVTYGFDGVSMNDIAKEAGITYALTYHHFQDKADLWVQVKEMVYKENMKVLDYQELEKATLKKALQILIESRCKLFSNKEFTNVVCWQFLHPNDGQFFTFRSWNQVLQTLQDQGKIRSDLDIEATVIWMASSVSYALMLYGVIEKEKTRDSKIKAYCKMLIKEFEEILRPIE